jgi:hypothetical protein
MSSSDERGGSAEALERLDEAASRVEDQVRQHVPTKAHVERVDIKATRNAKIGIAISMLVAILAVAFSAWNTWRISENAAQTAITQAGIESLEAANERLEERGLPQIPIPDPGGSISADDALAAAAAAILYDRIEDDPQFKGPEGDAGSPGEDGEPGDPCEPVEPGCRGPGGPEGAEGDPGQSPACLEEPLQCRGADGRGIHDLLVEDDGDFFVKYTTDVDTWVFIANIKGPPGDPGVPGVPGPSCPPDFPVQSQRTFLTGLLPGESETVVVCTQG